MLRRLLPLVLLALLALPAGASANQNSQFSIMMDDDLLIYRGDNVRDSTLQRMKSLGVDYVRVTVLWEVVAENAKKGKRKRTFKPDNPATYPRTNWDRYDRLVKACLTLKIGCYLNVTGPGPSWAHKKPPKGKGRLKRTWYPKEREYFKFVKAVGKRYSGTYRDENDYKTLLPKVSFWSLWNEPNQAGWLTPQWARKGSVVYSASAATYRKLWYYGRAALDQTGHANDIVLLGETAPLGSSAKKANSATRPKQWIRELFCVNARNQPFTGRSASARGCSNLAKIDKFRSSGWAHHPYTKLLAPTARDRSRDSISMANVAELGALLDIMAAKTGRISAGVPTWLTEFGYETNPPDPFNGIPLDKQAEYNNTGDYLAYRDPRVLAQAQFLLRDVEPRKRFRKGTKQYWFTYQSGLFGLDGTPKPAAAAYALPLMVTGKGIDSVGALATNFWGQLRFLPNGTAAEVLIQFRPQGAAEYTTVGDPVQVTNLFGFFEAARALPGPGTVRALWVSSTGETAASREIPVA